jgi:hypothetical protein
MTNRINRMTTRVSRAELSGYSRSEFKTMLKCLGFSVPRTLFNDNCIAEYRNKKYRFRYWGTYSSGDPTFMVDIAKSNKEFDRWAISTDRRITFEDFLTEFGVKRNDY